MGARTAAATDTLDVHMRIATGSRIARLFALAAVASGCDGCSLLFHADAAQCASTSDCTARGGAFANTVCSAGTGTCVPPDAGAMDSGSDIGDSDARTDAGDAPSDVDADAGTPCTSY